MDDREIEVGSPDILESPAPRPVSRRVVAAGLVLGLVAAAGAGYAVGDRRTPAKAPVAAPAPGATGPFMSGTMTATGNQCSGQPGKHQLQLGIEIKNQSDAAATLDRVRTDLPLGGLRSTTSRWGSCGQLPPVPSGPGFALPPGGQAWLTTTFNVLVSCPAPLPVRFKLDYEEGGQPATADLPGFVDLADVPYTSAKCTGD